MAELFQTNFLIIINDIIMAADSDGEKIIAMMEKIDRFERKKEYLTFDCALTYLMYLNIKDNQQLKDPIKKCKERIKKNLSEIDLLIHNNHNSL